MSRFALPPRTQSHLRYFIKVRASFIYHYSYIYVHSNNPLPLYNLNFEWISTWFAEGNIQILLYQNFMSQNVLLKINILFVIIYIYIYIYMMEYLKTAYWGEYFDHIGMRIGSIEGFKIKYVVVITIRLILKEWLLTILTIKIPGRDV